VPLFVHFVVKELKVREEDHLRFEIVYRQPPLKVNHKEHGVNHHQAHRGLSRGMYISALCAALCALKELKVREDEYLIF